MSGEFLPGVELSRRLYREAVLPLLESLPHSAGLLGPGSDVLGYDTWRSVDHDWGPRLVLFLEPADRQRHGARLDDRLRQHLPASIAGYPTNFGAPDGGGVATMEAVGGPPIRHRVVITDLAEWSAARLGFDPREGVGLLDWLATPTQRLAEATGGEVFHDDLGLAEVRERLRWYPPDVWRYVLACQWRRIAQEEPFVGRCVEVGDEAGAAVVTGRLAHDLMRLALLMHRRYPPYSKWLGTAFARLPGTAAIAAALSSRGTVREGYLADAYRWAANVHNGLELTEPLDPEPRWFHDRPFLVSGADRFRDALRAGIVDEAVAALPDAGAIDQFADSTDLLGDLAIVRAVTRAALGPGLNVQYC
jgi:hypothetical protein